jgi:hypothetical protein
MFKTFSDKKTPKQFLPLHKKLVFFGMEDWTIGHFV